jgi:hypothetical protein
MKSLKIFGNVRDFNDRIAWLVKIIKNFFHKFSNFHFQISQNEFDQRIDLESLETEEN